MKLNCKICRKCLERMSEMHGDGRETRFEIETPGYDVGVMTQEEIDALPSLFSLARIVKPDWLHERIWNLPCIYLTCDDDDAKKVHSMTKTKRPSMPLHGVLDVDEVEGIIGVCSSMNVEIEKNECMFYAEHMVSQFNENG